MPCLLLALFCLAAGAGAQDDGKDLLERAKRNVLDTIEQLPRYVCTLTVDRAEYEPGRLHGSGERQRNSCAAIAAEADGKSWKRSIVSSDRLRLDVAIGSEPPRVPNEMYSWVGADRFSDRSLFELVPEGALSTGSFGSLLASIFADKAAEFSYRGSRVVNGRAGAEFEFRIPARRGEYLYVYGTAPGQEAAIGSHGSFIVDPATCDIVRLVVYADELPGESGACEVTQTLDYARVRLHGLAFLLPGLVRLRVTYRDGTQAENAIRYSACHEFAGESTVRFDGAPEPGIASGKTNPAVLDLPPGLPFQLVFMEPIDPATAAAGDPIRAVLETPIRDRSSKVLVPGGSRVTGRILKVKRFYSSPGDPAAGEAGRRQPSLAVAIRLETLELGGKSYPFRATLFPGARKSSEAAGALSRQEKSGTPDAAMDSSSGTFEFWDPDPNFVVESGLQATWFTR